MKTYQLKIMIKNSKPPVWRRCVVPSGITFEMLANILNIVMGWSGKSESEFEFFHRKLYLASKAQEGRKGEFLNKKETIIDSFLEEEEWFTFTYCMEEACQHRVTIEEVTEGEEKVAVLKFKGNCFNENGETAKEYDIDAVNQQLSQLSFVEENKEAKEATEVTETSEKEAGLEGQFHLVMEQLFTQMAKAENGEVNQQFLRRNASTAAAMTRRNVKKIYPNDPCICGSGKKYKHCCKGK